MSSTRHSEAFARKFAVAAIGVALVTLTIAGATAPYIDPHWTPTCAVASPQGPSASSGELKPTTPTAIGYFCIFDSYFSGPVLDSRSLLLPAFAAFIQELKRRALELSEASLPALVSKIHREWTRLRQVYGQMTARLPGDPEVRQRVAGATSQDRVDGLGGNHVGWDQDFNFCDVPACSTAR